MRYAYFFKRYAKRIAAFFAGLVLLFKSSPTLDDHAICKVDIKNGLNDQEPLFLRSKNQLWIPDGPNLIWIAGQSTPIACPGDEGRNTIVDTDAATATITCVEGTVFKLEGKPRYVQIADIACTSRPTGSVQNTDQRCGDGNGTLLNLGFDVPDGFVPYFQSCYNMDTASVIYTRHEIAGGAIDNKVQATKKDKNRPSFKAKGIPPGLALQTAYEQTRESAFFMQLLGSADKAQRYSTDYLSRGHLTPAGDGIFRPWWWATYFFVNAAPQWQATNGDNWEAVEDAVRSVAGRRMENMLIFTGAHDILKLPHANGRQVPITLKDDKIQVPKWFWKIIKSPSKDVGIALVSYNNPYDSILAEEMLCEDICAQHGWSKPNYRKVNKGYTYCCTVASLRQAIPSIPDEAHANDILSFS